MTGTHESGVDCAVCGCDRHSLKRSLPGVETTLYECSQCGFVFCRPLPTVDSASSGDRVIHTEETFSWNVLRQSEARRPRYAELARERHRHYKRLLGRSRYRLLEIGCGTAGIAHELTAVGVEYHGIDLDERMVRHAHENGIESVESANFFSYPVSQPFDVVCFSQVLEHITEPVSFIERVCRALTPRGVLHLYVPNHHALAGHFRRGTPKKPRWGGIHWPHHAMAYQSRTLRYLLEEEFDVNVFTANPDDTTWGQPGTPGWIHRMFFRMASCLDRNSLLVAVGTRRPELSKS